MRINALIKLLKDMQEEYGNPQVLTEDAYSSISNVTSVEWDEEAVILGITLEN